MASGVAEIGENFWESDSRSLSEWLPGLKWGGSGECTLKAKGHEVRRRDCATHQKMKDEMAKTKLEDPQVPC